MPEVLQSADLKCPERFETPVDREKVDQELHQIMKNIYATISQTARQYGREDNFVDGANIASFLKVSGAMIDQGYV